MAFLATSRKSPRVLSPGWRLPLARWGPGARVPPLVSFSAAWAALAARDSLYSRHFLSRFLSPADHFSFPRGALLWLPCSVRLSPGSRNFFSIMSHIGNVDRSARRILVGVPVLINPVRAQPFAGPVRAGPNPPALVAEVVGVSFHPQQVFHCLQAVGAHIPAELEASGHAAFALGVAVAAVLTPDPPTQ